jgi:hypothetical protein
MVNRVVALSGAAMMAASLAFVATSATAMPLVGTGAIKNATPVQVETVGWGGWGWGVGAGLLGGAIIGSALAARPYYYYPPAYYAPYPYPPPAGYAPPGAAGGPGAVAACARRYRSYDPASGTFLGTDGARHPCP